MRRWIRRALTRRVSVRRGTVEVEPSDCLVYGLCFAVVALVSLTVLEVVYIVVLRCFSSDIFAAVTLVIGTILGAFFGGRG